jgi:hypothetical protein
VWGRIASCGRLAIGPVRVPRHAQPSFAPPLLPHRLIRKLHLKIGPPLDERIRLTIARRSADRR